MSELKVLMLVHPDCFPPAKATIAEAEWAPWKTEFYVMKALKQLGHQVLLQPVSDDLEVLKRSMDMIQPHIVFNLLEEFKGVPKFESHVVSFLELLGVAYTGCNPQGLALGRDKALAKKILKFQGIETPQFFSVDMGKKPKIPDGMNYPMIVKSLDEEASLGISQDSIVHDEKKLLKRIQFIHDSIGTPALVEEYILGRELYVGVIGNQQLKVLPPWELHFGDLEKKGHPIATRSVKFNKEYCEKHKIKRRAAKGLNPWLERKIGNLSRDAFRALKMTGYARMDLRLTEDQKIYFIEANPNPELADRECFANAARHMGLTYAELIGKIVRLGLAHHKAA
ncbi:MAG: D-alanine--D-alanine ligase [Pseudomonadota bacterium]